MSELIQRHTELSANIIAFCRYLRQKGFALGPLEEADALRALEILAPFDSAEAFRLALRATLARNLSQQQAFDDLYAQYWKELEKAADSKIKDGKPEQSRKKQGQQQPSLNALKSWLHGKTEEEHQEIASYSPGTVQSRKDFSAFTEEELWEVLRLIHRIARSLALRYSRRQRHSRRPFNLDLRRTLRLNLRRGGEILDLAFQRRQRHRQQIVLLCDVSKSMDLYSRFLVQFIYAFQNAYRRIETFVFGTELHRVTNQLKQRDYRSALDQLAGEVTDWSGGTRIGESLHQFLERYGGKMLNRQTIVLIMSDGWDTGDAGLLAESMRRIQGKAAKVIWLNPLAGNPQYSPKVKGMQAAMPYIDVFASAHNVESLRKVAKYL